MERKSGISRYSPQRIARGLSSRTRTILEGIVGQAVNIYYGNSAGLKANWRAEEELASLRHAFATQSNAPPHPDVASAVQANDLNQEGYVLLGPVASKNVIANVVRQVKAALEDPSSYVWSPNKATKHLLKPEKCIEGIGLLLNKNVLDILRSYYKCAFRIESVRVWRNHYVAHANGDRHDVFSNTFHCDNCRVTGLRMFVYLTDGVNRSTGAFRFHDIHSSKSIVRRGSYFHRAMLSRRMRERLNSPTSLKYFEGNAGDAAIINTQWCMHAASIPREGSYRDILQFELYPTSGPLIDQPELLKLLPPDVGIEVMAKLANKSSL